MKPQKFAAPPNINVLQYEIITFVSGADTEIYLALLPPNTTSPKGEFVAERVIQVGFPEFQNKIGWCLKSCKGSLWKKTTIINHIKRPKEITNWCNIEKYKLYFTVESCYNMFQVT